VLPASFLLAQDTGTESASQFMQIKDIIENADIYQAIQYINKQDTPEEAAEIYAGVVKDFYWKDKDVERTIIFGQAALHYLLLKVDEFRNSEPERGFELKKQAKAMAFNLASFCWPGWNEEGILLSVENIQTGLETAKLNLRLADELGDESLSLSVDYWVLGAQYIATQNYEQALNAFGTQKKLANEAGDKLNELLADGYIGITMIISGDENGQDFLGEAIKALTEDGSEDAKFYIEQFNTVLNVFIK
jgi:hypothetical protein